MDFKVFALPANVSSLGSLHIEGNVSQVLNAAGNPVDVVEFMGLMGDCSYKANNITIEEGKIHLNNSGLGTYIFSFVLTSVDTTLGSYAPSISMGAATGTILASLTSNTTLGGSGISQCTVIFSCMTPNVVLQPEVTYSAYANSIVIDSSELNIQQLC